jgi:SAM-dependent methyltransferase
MDYKYKYWKRLPNMTKTVLSVYRSVGLKGVADILGYRFFAKKAGCFPLCAKLLSNGVGLEIGGPSDIFREKGILPIYPVIVGLDNCNYADRTIWEGVISAGDTFQYAKHRPLGKQYISEATDLSQIKSGTYDFVLSSHVMEHIANPLRALYEWTRILKEEGVFILVVPHREGTFDHKRKVTALSHLIEDYERGTQEDDLSHVQEVINLHDLERSPEIADAEELRRQFEDNYTNRSVHHHAFDTSLVVRMVHQANLRILGVEPLLPYHIIIIAQKVQTGCSAINDNFLANDAKYRRVSPFVSDRQPEDPTLSTYNR